ncbi:uncharacterized protein LOC122383528 [Amphibalanus amphitrite]|uniref:uncharacterized protein LOC122383528 n=1 Tax=Amphibalanus amphitrite TaxID=1232801 RepID=UPI001C906ED8|nr:uncharacterized protein LOC122383528 [Amphibalanus amphitrite]
MKLNNVARYQWTGRLTSLVLLLLTSDQILAHATAQTTGLAAAPQTNATLMVAGQGGTWTWTTREIRRDIPGVSWATLEVTCSEGLYHCGDGRCCHLAESGGSRKEARPTTGGALIAGVLLVLPLC